MFMGEDWWFKKMTKYKGVRDRISGDVDLDAMSVAEAGKYQEDLMVKKRMEERKREIRNEKSSVRKALLEAKQFMDDFKLQTGAVTFT